MLQWIQKIKNWFYIKTKSYRVSNKDRIITMFAVFAKEPGAEIDNTMNLLQTQDPVTFTPTMQDAILVIEKLSYSKHYDHYSKWCELHDKECGWSCESWQEYKEVTQNNPITDDNFLIIQLTQTISDVAAICRAASHCMPVGLGYEKDFELPEYVKDRYNPTNNSLNVPRGFSDLMASDHSLNKAVHHYTNELGKSEAQNS